MIKSLNCQSCGAGFTKEDKIYENTYSCPSCKNLTIVVSEAPEIIYRDSERLLINENDPNEVETIVKFKQSINGLAKITSGNTPYPEIKYVDKRS